MGARRRRRRRGPVRPARRRGRSRSSADPRRARRDGDPQRARHRRRAAHRPVRGAPAVRALRPRLLRRRVGQRPADRRWPPTAPTAWGTPRAARGRPADDRLGRARAPRPRPARRTRPPRGATSRRRDTADAPPPAEPPSPTEIERADIPEPPAMTDRASEPEPADSYSTPGEPASTDFDTHSPPDRQRVRAAARSSRRRRRVVARRRSRSRRRPTSSPSPPTPPEAATPEPVARRRPRPRARRRARPTRPPPRPRAGAERRRARDHQVAARRDRRRRRSSRPCCSSDHSSAALSRDRYPRPPHLGAMELIFPSDSVIVVAGVPGAGKTTLLRRAVDRAAARVVDTDDRRRRGPLLYPGHYARIAAAIAGGRPGRDPLARHAPDRPPHDRAAGPAARPPRAPRPAPRRPRDRRGRPARPRPDGRARRDGPSGRPLAGRCSPPAGRPARAGSRSRCSTASAAAEVTALRFVTAAGARAAAGVNGSSASRTQSGIGVFCQVLASTNTCRSQPSTSSSSPRRISMSSFRLVVPKCATAGADRDHVVEARGRAEADVRLRDHDVDPAALDHRVPAPHRARAPQLADRVVEVGHVVRVEDDPLRVALAVADAQLVDEAGHRRAR